MHTSRISLIRNISSFSLSFGLNLSVPFCLELAIIEMDNGNEFSSQSNFSLHIHNSKNILYILHDFISIIRSFLNKVKSFVAFCRLNSDTNWNRENKYFFSNQQFQLWMSNRSFAESRSFVENNKQSQVSCLKWAEIKPTEKNLILLCMPSEVEWKKNLCYKAQCKLHWVCYFFRYLFHFVWICVRKHKIEKQVTQQLILLRTEWSSCLNFNAATRVYVWYSILNIHISIVRFFGSPVLKLNESVDIDDKIRYNFILYFHFIREFIIVLFFVHYLSIRRSH